MNIIIPYRPDGNNGLELMYALRSIEKYLTGYGEIFIIGEKLPTWCKDVHLIQCNEASNKNPANIANKILRAFQEREVGNKVIQWHDDIYLTKPLHVNDIKYWHDGDLENAILHHHGSYKTIITNTALKTTEAEKYYDIHTPIIYEREAFQRMTQRFNWAIKGYLVKTLYCNTAGVTGVQMEDCKVGGPCSDIRSRIAGHLFFSTGPQGMCPEMVEVLEEIYPGRSRWEK